MLRVASAQDGLVLRMGWCSGWVGSGWAGAQDGLCSAWVSAQGKEHPALLGYQNVPVVPDPPDDTDGSLLQGVQLDPV